MDGAGPGDGTAGEGLAIAGEGTGAGTVLWIVLGDGAGATICTRISSFSGVVLDAFQVLLTDAQEI